MPTNSPLSSLPRHTPAKIVEVADVPECQRLESMGFVPGTRVEVMRTGSPLLIKLIGTTFGISPALAKSVLVTTENLDEK